MTYHIDAALLRAAAGQCGAVTQQQLIDSDISPSTITRRVSSGLLRSVARGIYVVPLLAGPDTVLWAAQLAIPTAVASHRSAARLHGMNVTEASVGELTIASRTTNRIMGTTLHETRYLPADDIMTIDGLRVTKPARTLVDLSSVLGERHYRTVVEEQLFEKVPSAPNFLACHRAMARQGRAGSTIIRTILDELLDDQPYPESQLEVRTYLAFTDRGVGYVRRQFAPPWYNGIEGIVDFADPVGCTIIEADGRGHHRLELDRRRDAARDRRAMLHGWATVRVGWHEIVHRTDSTMAEIIEILEQRRNAAA